MTPVTGDFDEMLRRALHAEADSIEPADGGLDRIRLRTRAPWLVRQASLMLTECVDLVRLIGIRLEPKFSGARATISERGGAWAAFVGLLSSIVSLVVTPPRRRGATHRSGPGGTPHGRARAGSGLGWLRPALAVAGAVVIVAAGVYGLAQVRDTLVLELFPGSTPADTGGGGDGHQVPTMTGQSPTGAILPTSPDGGSASPSPTSSCSSSPAQRLKVTPTPVVTSPTATDPTDTPTPTLDPTDTPTPTPTDSAATTALSVNAAGGIQTVQNVAPAATCTNSTGTGAATG